MGERERDLQGLAVEAAIEQASEVGLILGGAVRLELRLNSRERVLHELAEDGAADAEQHLQAAEAAGQLLMQTVGAAER